MGIILEAVKRTAVTRAAAFFRLVEIEIDRAAGQEHHDAGSTTTVITDFEKPELLDGSVIASGRKFGFSGRAADGAGNSP